MRFLIFQNSNFNPVPPVQLQSLVCISVSTTGGELNQKSSEMHRELNVNMRQLRSHLMTFSDITARCSTAGGFRKQKLERSSEWDF